MTEQDTQALLKECDSGSRMAVDAIDEILPHVRDRRLSGIMTESRRRHEKLEDKLAQKLPGITQANWQILPLHIDFQGAHVLNVE